MFPIDDNRLIPFGAEYAGWVGLVGKEGNEELLELRAKGSGWDESEGDVDGSEPPPLLASVRRNSTHRRENDYR